LLDMDQILWSSPPWEYDVTLLSLKSQPDALTPLDLAQEAPAMSEPAPRFYIIGHPGGRDLEFSLEDSQLVAANDKLLHYRTPTQGGSSGSPVFDDQVWNVVALHHAGRPDMPRLDGKPGTYEANEAISIRAIRAAINSRRTAANAV
jgi:V8-like Glu-specific endopeptidase